jgi:hypothetical protein
LIVVIHSDIGRFSLGRGAMITHHEWFNLFALTNSIYNSLLGIQMRLSQILLSGELDWIVPFSDGRFGYLFLQRLPEHVLSGPLHQRVSQQILLAA